MIDTGNRPACLRGSVYFTVPSYDNPAADPEADPPVVPGPPILTAEYGYIVFATSTSSLIISDSGSKSMNVTMQPYGTTDYFQVGWPVIAYGGSTIGPTDDYMIGRITTVNTEGGSITFTAFYSKGSGTFDSWYVSPQSQGSSNYEQNINYSAKDTPVRHGGDRGSVSLSFPTNITNTTHVITNTTTSKVGYTETTYALTARVVEAEYENHRPYVGVTVTAKRTLTTTTRTYTYPGPEAVDTSSSDVTHTYSFTEDDFDPDGSYYEAGDPTVYDTGTGIIISYPTPSVCEKDNISASGASYESYRYNDTYSQLIPGGPYVLTSYVRKSKSFSSSVFYAEPTPTAFFEPG
jgi:hypothetical protein